MNNVQVVELNIQDIIPNRFQPREIFDEKALNELAESIKQHGIIQPIIVRKIGEKYEIIAGERRYKASQIAGKTTVPAIIKDVSDEETSKIALLENLQRKDLTPIELARTYQNILKLSDMTQGELAKNLGVSQSDIANKMRLLNLGDKTQEALLEQKISERHARSLLNVKSEEEQDKLLNKVIDNRMTVRQLDEEILSMNSSEEQEKLSTKEELIQPVESLEQQKTIETLDNVETLEELPFIEQEAKIEPLPFKLDNINSLADEEDENPFNNIYDMRFAVNNIRQAIQNTEKFGFNITADEYDLGNRFQIVIQITKKD